MINEPHITEYFGGRRVESWHQREPSLFVAVPVNDGDEPLDLCDGATRNEAVNNALAAFPDKTKKKPLKKKGKKK